MASTYSPTLRIELIGNGEQAGTWGTTTNNNLGAIIEQAITGVQTITMGNAPYTLTAFDGAIDEARNAVLVLGGTVTSPQDLIAPAVEKTYIIKNNTGSNVTVKTSGGSGVTFVNGQVGIVYCDGTNFYSAVDVNNITGNVVISGNLSATGNIAATKNVTGNNATFTGTVTANAFSGVTGRVVQVVTSQYKTTVSTTSSSFVSTGHTATITPTSALSKILVLQSATLAQTCDSCAVANTNLTIYRDSTNLAGSNGIMGNVNVGYYGSIYGSAAISLLDSPATTNATTYTVYYRNTNSNSLYNFGFGDQLANLTLLEIL